jgi:hypothetical protein
MNIPRPPHILIVAGLLALPATLPATLLFYEGFDYTVGGSTTGLTTLGSSSESPDFYGDIDTNAFGAGTNQELQVLSGSVTGSNASPFSSSGNSLSWQTGWANGFAGLNTAISPSTSEDYYFSFLARSSSTNSLTISFEISNGGNQRLQAGVNGTSFFATSANATSDTDTGGTFAVDTTYFIVGKMSIGATDTISLAAYAPGDTVDASEPATWMASASGSTGTANLNNIRYRVYGGNAGEAVLDEVRFGTTWEAVAIPEPSTLMLVGVALAGVGLLHRRKRF